MTRTPPSPQEKPAPYSPKRHAGRPMSLTEARNNAEKTPCPIRAWETSKSTSQSEDTETKNNEKYGIVVAGTPLSSPTVTPAIDPTPFNNTTEQYDGPET